MDIKAKITIFDADTGETFIDKQLLFPTEIRESCEFEFNDIYHFAFNFCKFNRAKFEVAKFEHAKKQRGKTE